MALHVRPIAAAVAAAVAAAAVGAAVREFTD